MKNKQLGSALLAIALLLAAVLFVAKSSIYSAYDRQISFFESRGEPCPTEERLCPHAQRSRALTPIWIGFALLGALASLGLYLLLFERTQEAILRTLAENKARASSEEKFALVLSALSPDEAKVLSAVREQDGISQSTLALRTDFSKPKLSLVLAELERRGLIKKIREGKINKIWLKRSF